MSSNTPQRTELALTMNPQRAINLFRSLQHRKVGGWTISSYIGSGGSAVVMEGEKAGLTGAVKVIDPDLVSEFGLEGQLSRIRLEARLKDHGHPNLINIIEADQCEATSLLYVTMPVLRYSTLSSFLSRIPKRCAGSIKSQLASAVLFLEENEICHRDIKPDNVMISDDFKHAVLMDLGIISPFTQARDMGADPSGERFIGTARYASPEFVRKQMDRTADGYRALSFYQLGGILHDLIMGYRLFESYSHPYAILLDAITHKVPLVESTELDEGLIFLARDCLQKRPDVRLKMVTYKRLREPDLLDISKMRDRVKAAKGAIAAIDEFVPYPDKSVSRSQLTTLARGLRDQIRFVAEEGDDFPPAIIDWHVQANSVDLSVIFDPAPNQGIQRGIHADLAVRALLSEPVTFTMDAKVGWADDRASVVQANEVHVCIVRGAAQDVSKHNEELFYKIVNAVIGQPKELSSINIS